MASEYASAGKPAVFLEQHVDFPMGKRIGRWWAAYNSTAPAYLPLVMVDSGHRISSGSQNDFKATYRALVDAELARPPQGEINAYTRRVGSRMRIYARLRNAAGTALSASGNDAALHALVWEDAHVGVTNRTVRAAPWVGVSPDVTPGGEFTATLETSDLPSVNWSALHTVVVADYLPGPGPAYDMLQGAWAEPAALAADPQTVTLAFDANTLEDRTVPVRLVGPYVLNWTAVANVPWIAVAPDSGSISVQPALEVRSGMLSPGWQQGVVTFSASSEDGMSFAQTIAVSAFSGPRVVRVGTATAARGSTVSVPVEFSALGDENALSFSLAFDPAVLSSPSVSLGPDAGAAVLTTDTSQAAGGHLAASLVLPAGQAFDQGKLQLVVLSFRVAPEASGQAAEIIWADQPVARQITGVTGGALTATYLDGAVLLADAPIVRAPRRRLTPGGN
ncbi:MAG: cohesin domain-containing protein [Thermoanaerobaculaceae bacterium]|nr:cohesin domain-containing protein [Thermoanaerobaculaceae bacterium]